MLVEWLKGQYGYSHRETVTVVGQSMLVLPLEYYDRWYLPIYIFTVAVEGLTLSTTNRINTSESA